MNIIYRHFFLLPGGLCNNVLKKIEQNVYVFQGLVLVPVHCTEFRVDLLIRFLLISFI